MKVTTSPAGSNVIITAIKYRTSGSANPEVFRFTAGTAGLRHAICFQTATEHGLEKALSALALVLNGSSSEMISDAAIQIADSAGDTWVLTRGTQGFSVSRNGTTLSPEQIKKSLISALLDIDLAIGSASGQESGLGASSRGVYADGDPIAAILEVNRGADGLLQITNLSRTSRNTASRELATNKSGPDFKVFAEDSLRSSISAISTFIGPNIAGRIESQREILPQLIAEIEPLTITAREMQRQLKEVETPGAFSLEDQKRLDSLLPEIELIDKIKSLAMPLLDPSDGISAIQDRLRAIEHELSLRLASSGTQTLPELTHPVLNREWRKALRPLAQYQASKALLEQWRATLDSTRDELDPLVAEHLHSVEESIRRDSELSSELEASIQFLRLKMAPVPSSIAAFQPVQQPAARNANQQSPNSKGGVVHQVVNTWFDKLRDSIQGAQPLSQPATSVQRPQEFPPRAYLEMLEATEVAVTSTTKRLEVMQSHLEAIRSEIDGQRDSLANTLSRIEVQCQEANRTWLEVAKEAGIGQEAADFQVDQLIDLLLNRFELLKLQEERDELRAKLQDRLSRFDALERLIVDWRHLTDSQKALDLSHPGIVISEARSIIRYREEKNRVAERLRQLRERGKSAFSQLARMEENARKLENDWQAVLRANALPSISPADPRWPATIDAARRIISLQQLISEFERSCEVSERKKARTALEEEVSREAAGRPVQIHVWRINSPTEEDREHFLRFAREQSSGALLVVLTEDTTLAAQMFHQGSGRAIEIKQQSARIPAARPVNQSRTEQAPLLNTKARQALAALTSGRK